MINNSKHKSFFDEIFDVSSWHLDAHLIAKRDWASIIVLDIPYIETCQRIFDKTNKHSKNYISLSYGGDLLDANEAIEVPVNAEKIQSEINRCLTRSLAITDDELRFVIFKEHDNEFYIIAGQQSFVDYIADENIKSHKECFFEYTSSIPEPYRKKIEENWFKYVSF